MHIGSEDEFACLLWLWIWFLISANIELDALMVHLKIDLTAWEAI